MDNQETVQAAIDSLRQDVEGLKTKLYLKDTAMELLLANLAKTEQELAFMQQQMDDVLLGSIATFAMPEPPEGWLACDGQEVSRQTYARLFAKIGTIFGEGDGENTFNLPDLQDVFVRGWDEKRKFGSLQEDQMQGHTHLDEEHSHQGSTNSTGEHGHSGESDWDGEYNHELFYVDDAIEKLQLTYFLKGTFSYDKKYCDNKEYIKSAGSHSHSFSTASASANLGLPCALSHSEPRFGGETRPRNVALLFCIKY